MGWGACQGASRSSTSHSTTSRHPVTLPTLALTLKHLKDLSPLTDDDFESLRVLDCDSNEIADVEQIEFLGCCKQLQALTVTRLLCRPSHVCGV